MTPAVAIVALLLAAAPPRHVTLVYAADLGGWLEPCGCSANQRGGLARAATAIAAIRKENPDTIFVAGGDLLFDGLDVRRIAGPGRCLGADSVADDLTDSFPHQRSCPE